MELTGTEILIQSLVNHHVDTIFGYPGACVISILDNLYDNKDIRQILVRHEQGAVHAACGYAQLANKPGIVLVTSRNHYMYSLKIRFMKKCFMHSKNQKKRLYL